VPAKVVIEPSALRAKKVPRQAAGSACDSALKSWNGP
jgi:hypothetical protein